MKLEGLGMCERAEEWALETQSYRMSAQILHADSLHSESREQMRARDVDHFEAILRDYCLHALALIHVGVDVKSDRSLHHRLHTANHQAPPGMTCCIDRVPILQARTKMKGTPLIKDSGVHCSHGVIANHAGQDTGRDCDGGHGETSM